MDGNVYAFGEANGALAWKHKTDGPIAASPKVQNGVVYLGTLGKTFYALDAASGEPKWTFAAQGRIFSTAP